MASFEDYLAQSSSQSMDKHYDEHTDRWVDEAGVSVWGRSGHVDSHTDTMVPDSY